MNNIKRKLKIKFLNLIELIPYGRDLYLVMTENRRSINYKGVFDSFEQTLRAMPVKKANNYDVVNANKATNNEMEKQLLDNWFHDTDYPLLYWMSKLLGTQSNVLELGGSVGHFFYTIQKKFCLVPEKVKWTIAELPEAVKLGRELANERMEDRLSFFDSNEIALIDPADIFLTAGTLQYMSENLSDILKTLKALPKHVLVNNLPVHSQKSFWTLQNLGLCEVPYRVYAKPELINSMNEIGYHLVAEWLKPREIEIPFNRSLVIDGYLGFYFLKKD